MVDIQSTSLFLPIHLFLCSLPLCSSTVSSPPPSLLSWLYLFQWSVSNLAAVQAWPVLSMTAALVSAALPSWSCSLLGLKLHLGPCFFCVCMCVSTVQHFLFTGLGVWNPDRCLSVVNSPHCHRPPQVSCLSASNPAGIVAVLSVNSSLFLSSACHL